jgi:glycosyltransferase involved in cell wall biosynthesis
MKILMVHNAYQQAGGEEVVFQSEKSMLEQNGHEVIPYVRSNMELRDARFVEKIAVAPRMVWSEKARIEIAALLDSEHPDIVHIHNTFMVISPSVYSACLERRVPVVQTLHNFRLLCPAGSFFRDGEICEECVDNTLLRSILHRCYRNSRAATAGIAAMLAFHRGLDTWRRSVARFITLTNFAKEKFIESGFSPEKFAVKPNFTDQDPGERVGPGEYAVFVGRLFENKGVRVLLEAWKKLPDQYPLQIVGDGPDLQALKDYACELQLTGIVFRERLSRSATIETVKGARFMILPSIWYEGFPMCIVESFACGTPVLCSRIGGLPEIVDDHVSGLHFTPGDAQALARAVEWAWNHPKELVQMGHAARRKYETAYNAEQNYSLLMDIYEQALAASARASH